LMLCLLAALLWAFGLGLVAMLGVVIVVALLTYEHSLISADDLSKLNAAFFTMNGIIAVVFFLFLALDLLLHRSGKI
jgi:4-hydroxybenzoate polyprenyltransferase